MRQEAHRAELLAEADTRRVGDWLLPILCDITQAADVARLAQAVAAEAHGLDALVNNAGHLIYAPVELTDDDEAHKLFETLVFAPMRLARLALPHMRERQWGRIVNISSLVGRVPMPMLGWYSAAKHALEAVSDAMRVEVASSGVAVVLVEPGTIDREAFGVVPLGEGRAALPIRSAPSRTPNPSPAGRGVRGSAGEGT